MKTLGAARVKSPLKMIYEHAHFSLLGVGDTRAEKKEEKIRFALFLNLSTFGVN
jgi:hypothetical protein